MKNEKLMLTPEFISAFSALTSLIVIGTVVYHYLEDWSWITSLYFVVATLTTVGYGDIHPTNDVTRLFTVFFILIGVTVAISSITVIGGRYLARREQRVTKHSQTRRNQNSKI
ncbi:MAG: potassium channel family protein [bacterium]